MTAILYKLNPDTYDREILGNITESQRNFLADNLEDEFEEEDEFFLNPETLDELRQKGADKDLLKIFEAALAGEQEGVEIFCAGE